MDTKNNNSNLIFIYNIGIKEIILQEKVDELIGLEIYRKLEYYLRSSNENEIFEDNYQILKKIENWINGKKIIDKELIEFFSTIVNSFRTKSTEVSRNIIVFFSKKKEMFLIHTREDINIINYKFDELIRVGLSKENILRAFKLYISQDTKEIVLRYREKHKSKVLRRLFSIESFYFDYASMVRISCINDTRNISYYISLSPVKFLEIYNEGRLKIDPENKKIILPQDYMDIVSLKVKNETFRPNKINNFIDSIKKEFDNPIIEQIDKYLKHYKAKRLELKIDVESWSIDRFAITREENYQIIEYPHKIEYILENGKSSIWGKSTIEWGTLVLLDEDMELSKDFLNVLEFEILKGTSTRRICFIQLEYKPNPLKIGFFQIYNTPEIKFPDKLIETLQNEFDKKYDPNNRTLILLIQLSVLNSSPVFQFNYFANKMIKEILKIERITINREIEENFVLEFKGNKFFQTHSKQDEIAKYITEKIQPNLSNSNIVALLLGYDETSDQLQPISYKHFKNEERKELQSKIIEILRNDFNFDDDNLIVDIYLLNQKKDKGLILVVSGYALIDDNNNMMKSLFIQ